LQNTDQCWLETLFHFQLTIWLLLAVAVAVVFTAAAVLVVLGHLPEHLEAALVLKRK
jgi:hypothetical protein